MYSDENYLWGIVAYYAGCTLVLLFLWRFRELLPGRHFRNQLLLLLSAIMLVPIKAYPDMGYMAPAWFVSLFEGLTGTSEMSFLRGAQPIIVSYLVVSFLYICATLSGLIKPSSAVEETNNNLETSSQSET
ncbi:hypothetical protein [Porticoccus sp.]